MRGRGVPGKEDVMGGVDSGECDGSGGGCQGPRYTEQEAGKEKERKMDHFGGDSGARYWCH